MGRKYDFVSIKKLQQIASGTALANGLIPARREDITRMYYAPMKKQIPIMKRCESGTVWVDKYYVAYQLGDGDVVYTYISQCHIKEEVNAYKTASRERGMRIPFPADILRCFKTAQNAMKTTGKPYWIAEPWAK